MLTIHQDGFRDVVCIMTRDYMIHIEHGSSSVQCLSAEYPAKSAIVLLSDLRDDGIHRPSIQFVVREDFERHAILLLITLDSL